MDGKGVEPYRYVNRLNLKRPFPKGVVFFCPRKLQGCNFPEICLAILRKKKNEKNLEVLRVKTYCLAVIKNVDNFICYNEINFIPLYLVWIARQISKFVLVPISLMVC